MEILDVRCQRRDVAIMSRNDDQRPPHVLPEPGNEESARRAGKTGHDNVGVALQGFGSNPAEIRRRGDSGENLRYALIENFHDPARAPKPAQ